MAWYTEPSRSALENTTALKAAEGARVTPKDFAIIIFF